MRMTRTRTVTITAAITLAPVTVRAQDAPERFVERPLIGARHGVVTSLHPLASMSGMRILAKGGNAFDAAVATGVASNVVDPKNGTIGGNGFATIYVAREGRVRALNFYGTAPAAATIEVVKDKYHDYGALSVALPTTLKGYQELLESYGTMGWAEVLEPAIELAEKGFVVPHDWARVLQQKRHILERYPTTMELFMPGGEPLQPGQVFVQRTLAQTLRAIAREGPDVFYEGEIARRIVNFLQENGGLVTYEDLANYEARWVQPIHTDYRGYTVYTQPPNSSAIALLMQLNMLESYDLPSLKHNSAEYLHLLGEVMRLAIADRNRYIADPDFVDVPVERLLSKEYAAQRRALIDPERTISTAQPGVPPDEPERENTTHLTVVDSAGNMVALTQTLGAWYGSGLVVDGVGIILSNQIRHLHMDRSSPSHLEPGKRPRSNQSPTVVLKDGRPFLAFGTPGSDGIWQRMTQVLVNIIDFGMDLQTAITAPRMIYGGSQETRTDLQPAFILEDRIPVEVRRKLEGKGFLLTVYPQDEGRLNGVMIDPQTGFLLGAADPRANTYAIGW